MQRGYSYKQCWHEATKLKGIKVLDRSISGEDSRFCVVLGAQTLGPNLEVLIVFFVCC